MTRSVRFLTPTVICLLGAVGGSGEQSPDADDWERANQATVRLRPAAFPSIPASVIQELERRSCSIPQAFSSSTAHNVIIGRFTDSGETDVAVLCSQERVSSILVFRGGSVESVTALASEADANFLQTVGPNGAIGFSRKLDVADPKYIRAQYENYGGPKPPKLEHDGINDIFVGKGSVVWYWHGGTWLQLTGAD